MITITRKPRTLVAGLALTAATAMLLTGCSVLGGTKIESCASLGKSVSDIAGEMASSFSDLQNGVDADAAIAKLDELSLSLQADVKKLGNADVKAAGEKADASLRAFVKKAKAAYKDVANADLDDVRAAATAVQDDFAAIATECTS